MEDFGLRYEIRFLQEGIFIALVFEGKYAEDKNFAVVKEFTGLMKQPPTIYKTATSKSVGYIVKALDNVASAVTVTQFLIENTYPILKEKNFQ